METFRGKNTHNLNDRISFKVTERGREILAAHFANLIESVPDNRFAAEQKTLIQSAADSTVAEDGTVVMPVWEMASMFGAHMNHESVQVIEQNSFKFLEQH